MRKKSKRKSQKTAKAQINTRVFFTNMFMVVSVVALVIALTLVAMGYRLTGGELTQYGMLQVESRPSGAAVELDDIKIDTTGTSRMVSSGKHSLLVTKSGYDVWRADVDVKSGLLTRIDYIRLFPVQRTIETVKEFDVADSVTRVIVSPTRDSLLVCKDGVSWAVIEGVDGRDVRIRDVEVPAWLIGQEISEWKWNKNGDRLFVHVAESWDWGVVDLRAPERSVNMSQEFSLKLDSIAIADDSGEKVFGLADGGLRVIDLKTRQVSGIKIGGVEEIGGMGEGVGYVRAVEGVREVGIYKEGNNSGSVLVKPKDGEVKVLAWKYWGEDVVAIVADGEITVMRGRTSGGVMEKMVAVELEEGADVGDLSLSPSGRFVVLGNSMVLDVNSGIEYKYGVSQDGWLDDFMMYAIRDGQLTVWDFNGGNKRDVSEATGYAAMIARGNGWLYHVVGDAGNKIVREKL